MSTEDGFSVPTCQIDARRVPHTEWKGMYGFANTAKGPHYIDTMLSSIIEPLMSAFCYCKKAGGNVLQSHCVGMKICLDSMMAGMRGFI